MSNLDGLRLTRRSLLLSSCVLPSLGLFRSLTGVVEPVTDYPAKAVPLTQVDVADEFWAPRMEVNRNVSIWHCFDRMKAHAEDFGSPRLIEGAAYMIAKRPDPKLEDYCDQVIDQLVAKITPRFSDPDKTVRVSGHFLEAGAAYYAATGKRKMLD